MSQIPSFLNEFPSHQIYIGGWRDGRDDSTNTTTNPYGDAELASIRQANQEDVDEAYRVAAEAQKDWAARAPQERSEVMHRAADYIEEHLDELVDLLVAESGSSVTKARLELGTLVTSHLREAASYPTRVQGKILPSSNPSKTNYVFREPLGVVGVISPWNFPAILSMRSLAPALALGNAAVLKPASDTPLTGGTLWAKVFDEAGLPAGVLNVVVGSGSVIGDYFVEHPTPSLISFTGSTPVGRSVAAKATGGRYIKRVALELGGNAPFVVLNDADLDKAVNAAVTGKFLHQGQICMAINRVIVEDSIYDDFVARYTEAVSQVPYGDAAQEENLVGPIINDDQLASVSGKINKAREEGATTAVANPIEHRVVPPHVFTDVTEEMELFREEIFGPVVGVIRAKDEEDALRLANLTEFGLSSAVFTQDMARGIRFARGLNVGMTHINDIPVNDEPQVMFGGEKNSGLGRFNGDWAIDEFTRDHWIGAIFE